ncbi:MAG: hypothetical protein CSA58_07785 [Micrococcales bacterium]|nr:MAG: hypothetical protein CSA58_07785 [Micrococcales bacterium]
MRARPIAYTFAVGIVVAMVALAVFVPGAEALDRIGFVAVGLLIAAVLYRQATVAAIPSATGLRVRNLIHTTSLEWAQIVNVRLGDDPWVRLDLSDGDTLSVMGIQRADGAQHTRTEATRLAELVALHNQADAPD